MKIKRNSLLALFDCILYSIILRFVKENTLRIVKKEQLKLIVIDNGFSSGLALENK